MDVKQISESFAVICNKIHTAKQPGSTIKLWTRKIFHILSRFWLVAKRGHDLAAWITIWLESLACKVGFLIKTSIYRGSPSWPSLNIVDCRSCPAMSSCPGKIRTVQHCPMPTTTLASRKRMLAGRPGHPGHVLVRHQHDGKKSRKLRWFAKWQFVQA